MGLLKRKLEEEGYFENQELNIVRHKFSSNVEFDDYMYHKNLKETQE